MWAVIRTDSKGWRKNLEPVPVGRGFSIFNPGGARVKPERAVWSCRCQGVAFIRETASLRGCWEDGHLTRGLFYLIGFSCLLWIKSTQHQEGRNPIVAAWVAEPPDPRAVETGRRIASEEMDRKCLGSVIPSPPVTHHKIFMIYDCFLALISLLLFSRWVMFNSFVASYNTGMGCHFLHQRIFATQGSNPYLLHCRQIL